MGDIPTQLITSIPVAAALIYVVKLFLDAQKEDRTERKAAATTANEVIERNTQAIISIEGILSECKHNQRVDK
jgi:hypothetical protein